MSVKRFSSDNSLKNTYKLGRGQTSVAIPTNPTISTATKTGTTTATVAYMNTSSMYVLNTVGTFQPYETILSNDTGKTCTITVINISDIVPYSGEIFYYKNIQPIDRTGITKEQVKLYLNF